MLGYDCGCLPNNTLMTVWVLKKSKHNFWLLAHHSGVLTYETKFEKLKKMAKRQGIIEYVKSHNVPITW